jgi:hypothetical protein
MGTVSINLRLSAELHGRLKEQAESDHRSLNSEILWLLAEALAVKEKSS